jgi:predicted RNase H-like nuclease (RuvC/YqgF family)
MPLIHAQESTIRPLQPHGGKAQTEATLPQLLIVNQEGETIGSYRNKNKKLEDKNKELEDEIKNLNGLIEALDDIIEDNKICAECGKNFEASEITDCCERDLHKSCYDKWRDRTILWRCSFW